MNFRNLLTSLIVCLFSFISAQDLKLIGEFNPCQPECYQYYFESNQPIYEFEIINTSEPSPNSHNINYDFFQDSFSFLICYEEPGTYTFNYFIYDFGNVIQDSFIVRVGLNEPVEIIELNPNCGPDLSFTACKGSTATYISTNQFDPNGNFNGTWVVTGADSYTILNDNSVSVVWGDGDIGTILYIQENWVNCPSEAYVTISLIDPPKSKFSIENAKNKYCLGEEIFLINESEDATSFIWNLGDGNTSTDVQPIISYDTPGNYIISLLAVNGCNCEDIYSLEIQIDEAWMPQIDCKGTICENTSVTYTSNDNCGTFNWSISSNGHITEGGAPTDNFITIDWGNGPEGYVNLEVQSCADDMCPTPAEYIIPIVSNNAPIKGNLTPCIGSTESYAITDFGATDYIWTITGGIIQAGQSTNAVMVKWNSTTGGNISVDYNNCYLKCGGTTSTSVIITEAFTLSGPTKLCATYLIDIIAKEVSSNNNALVNWNLYDKSKSVVTSQNNSSNFIYTEPSLVGGYQLIATGDNYCNKVDTLEIYFTPTSELPDSILGEKAICPGNIYEYEAGSKLTNGSFAWKISDGAIETELEGKKIVYTWTSAGPYTISLAQKNNNGDWCYSDYIIESLSEVTDLTLNGDLEVCPDEIATYAAPQYVGLDYKWEIVPESAGTIINGQGKQEIRIQWTQSGNQEVRLNACGKSETLTVTVLEKPIINLDYQDKVCYNLTTIATTSTLFDAYKWSNESADVIDQTSNPALSPGSYVVEVTDDRGCTQLENFTIEELPKPEINVSTPDLTVLCPANSPTYPTIHAVVSSGGYMYDWYKDNVSMGINTVKLPTSDIGNYKVLVTDQNGCTAYSNLQQIIECCVDCGTGSGPGPGGCSTLTGILAFDVNKTGSCSTLMFDNKSQNAKPGSFSWNFDDPQSGNNSSIEDSPTHSFSNAAFYKVKMNGSVEDQNDPGSFCSQRVYGLAISPMKAFFASNTSCPNAPTEFTDRSVSLPDYGIKTWEWNFGDPSSADNTSTDVNPTHIYSASGEYEVRLIIGDGPCTDTVINKVLVHELPTATIELTESMCEKIAGKFDLLTTKDVIKSNWNFGDPTSLDKNKSIAFTTYHIFENPGMFDVSSDMENIYGCKASTITNITIHENDLAGDIQSTNGAQICEASTTDLSAPIPNVTKWEWQDGSDTPTITVGVEGIYQVTVTNDKLCTYTPGNYVVDIIEAPRANVYAETYSDFETEIKTDLIPTICGGENFRIIATPNPNYSYSWSNSATTNVLNFSNDLGNLPAPGTHQYGLTITDNVTGCSHINPDFQIEILPNPTNLEIKSLTAGVLCGGDEHTLYVDNPASGIDYYWNIGIKSTSIETKGGGVFFVEAINQNGCSSTSNYITIASGPDVDQVPSGCFTRCNPDTLCMPIIQGAVTYQWFYNGTEVSAADNGTIPELIATNSGAYELVVTDNIGCSNTSEPLVLTLQDAVGVLEGKLYVDVNEDGVVDSGDTTKAGVTMVLSNGQTITTDENGCFKISNLDAGMYTLKADTTGLDGYDNLLDFDFTIANCDDTIRCEHLLIKNCIPGRLADRQQDICKGEVVTVEGQDFDQGGDFILYTQNPSGCQDSFKLTINLLPTQLLADQKEEICEGGSVNVEGKDYSQAGDYILYKPNANGCQDSFKLSIDILASQLLAEKNEHLCVGAQININGITYDTEGQYLAHSINASGCMDSFYVNITQSQLATLTIETTSPCENSDNGTILVKASGSSTYNYDLGSGLSNNNGNFDNITTGNYELVVNDNYGCEVASESIVIDPKAEISFKIINTEWNCIKASWIPKIELDAFSSEDITVEWSSGIKGLESQFTNEGWHTVTVSNDCESVTEDFLAEREYKYINIEMPNIFSPNGDGINEKFSAVLDQLDDAQVTYFVISDRAGRVVYRYQPSSSASAEWDGKYPSGDSMPIGVYFYKMEYQHNVCEFRRKETLSGDVTIVR